MEELKKEIVLLRQNVASMVDLIGELKKTELNNKQEIGALKSENENQKKQIRIFSGGHPSSGKLNGCSHRLLGN